MKISKIEKTIPSLQIATWQSIYKQPQKWFNNSVDIILMDECFSGDTQISTPTGYKSIAHLSKGDLIKNINSAGDIKTDEIVEVFENLNISN